VNICFGAPAGKGDSVEAAKIAKEGVFLGED